MCYTQGLQLAAETAVHRYQVWHISQNLILEWHSLVVVPCLKSKFFHVSYGCWLKNLQFSAVTSSEGPRDLKFGIQASNIQYFQANGQNLWPSIYIFTSKRHLIPESILVASPRVWPAWPNLNSLHYFDIYIIHCP